MSLGQCFMARRGMLAPRAHHGKTGKTKGALDKAPFAKCIGWTETSTRGTALTSAGARGTTPGT